MAVDLAPSPKRNRTRSPSYPYLDLPTALEKAAVLWRAEGRHAVAVNLAMQHWGYKEESSTGFSCIAALKKFGLVDHEGMGESRQVRLSNLALTILLDNDPGSAARRDALRNAALGPRIHAELWERYGAELPSDQSLRRFLVLERSFNEAAVDELLEEYRATMAFAGLNVGLVRGSAPAMPVTVAAATAGFAPLPPIAPVPSAVTVSPAVSPPSSAAMPTRPAAPVAPDVYESPRRPEPPRPAPRMPARAVGAPGSGGNTAAASPRQPTLFGDGEAAAAADAPSLAEEPPLPVRQAQPSPEREGGPWSMARRELPVPLDNDLVARVPYPMSEEDFALLMDTLQLWKKRLVQPQR